MLGVTHVQTGMYGDAIAEFQRAGKLTANSPEILGLLGYGHGRADMKSRNWLEELKRFVPTP
jgi:Flp pilus assembly protein TadD